MSIINAILIFTLIVMIHELGHFLLAKKNGVFVTEFSIGMGPRIMSFVKTRQGYRLRFFITPHDFSTTPEWKENTIYSWKLFPVGGSCMMLGEDEVIEDEKAFNKKGIWARISVIFAGPLFNFILAFVFSILIIGVTGYDLPSISTVAKDSPAQEAGLLPGDVITKINEKHVDISREVSLYLQFNPLGTEDVNITYLRDGKKDTVALTPEKVKTYMLGFGYRADQTSVSITELYEDLPMEKAGLLVGDTILKINDYDVSEGTQLSNYFQENPLTTEPILITYSRANETYTVEVTPVLYSENYSIGIAMSMQNVKTDFFGVIKYSAVEVKYVIVSTVKSLGQLIAGKLGMEDMAGPVGIVSMIGQAMDYSETFMDKVLTAVSFCVLLSANLGVMNLLPLPALDGGRLVFLFLELFRGKPVDQNKEGLVHLIGLVALMILMVFVMFNDISRLF